MWIVSESFKSKVYINASAIYFFVTVTKNRLNSKVLLRSFISKFQSSIAPTPLLFLTEPPEELKLLHNSEQRFHSLQKTAVAKSTLYLKVKCFHVQFKERVYDFPQCPMFLLCSQEVRGGRAPGLCGERLHCVSKIQLGPCLQPQPHSDRWYPPCESQIWTRSFSVCCKPVFTQLVHS